MASYSASSKEELLGNFMRRAMGKAYKLQDGETLERPDGPYTSRIASWTQGNRNGGVRTDREVFRAAPKPQSSSKKSSGGSNHLAPPPTPVLPAYDAGLRAQAAERTNAFLSGLKNPAFRSNVFDPQSVADSGRDAYQYYQENLPGVFAADARAAIDETGKAADAAAANLKSSGVEPVDYKGIFDSRKEFNGDSLYAYLSRKQREVA